MSKRTLLAGAAGILVLLAVAAAVLTATTGPAAQRFAASGAALKAGYGMGSVTSAPAMMPEVGLAVRDMALSEDFNPSPIMPPVPMPNGGQTAAEVDQKIIKNGTLRLSVDDVGDVSERIIEAAKARGGYVQTANVSERPDGTHAGYVAVRVPAKSFEEMLGAIRLFAKAVKEETTSGQDVTEQYTDLLAQIRNAQAQEATYLEVLKSARTVEDILKVQERLGSIRGQIESLQGRQKYLENATAFSTISVTLEEEPKVQVPTKEFRFGAQVKEAIQALVGAFQSLLVGLIWFVIVIGGLLLPFVLLGGLVWWLVRRRKDRRA